MNVGMEKVKLAASRRVYWLLLLPLLIFACSARKNPPAIWYVSNASGIETLNPTTLEQRTLVRAEPGTRIDTAELSPNGTYLAYRNYQPGGNAIWLANADGANPIRVTRIFSSTGFAWITDHSLVVMGINDTHLDPATGEVGLYDLVTKETQPLTLQDDPFYCDSGTYDSGMVRVPIANRDFAALGHLELDGSVLRAVPDIRLNFSQPLGAGIGCHQSWTANGAQIVFDPSKGDLKVMDLFVATQQGQTITRLTDWGKDYKQALLGPFAISPNGQWIVLNIHLAPRQTDSQNHSEVGLLSADGKTLQLFDGFRTEYSLVWSPDSRAVAMSLSRTDTGMSNMLTEIYVLDPESRQLKPLTSDGAFKKVFAWR